MATFAPAESLPSPATLSFANVDAEERVGRYFGRDSEAEAWSKFWSRYQST